MTINPAPAVMEFKTEEPEKFEDWIIRVRARLNYLASIVGRKSRTEAQEGQQEDLIAHLDDLLEDLSNVALEVKEMEIRAKEYYQDWLAQETEMYITNNTLFDKKGLPNPPAKKTAQDYCVKLNSSQRRILERIQAMSSTVDVRISVSQSMLRSLKPK